MWRYLFLIIKHLKLTNMSNLREKAIEIAKQTSSESAFMCGYDRACQEYEEKLRWIPVEEKLPERGQKVLVKIKTANNGDRIDIAYTNAHRQLILSLMNNYEEKYITHWRPIL